MLEEYARIKGEESFSQRRQEGKRHKDTGGGLVLNKRSESVSRSVMSDSL